MSIAWMTGTSGFGQLPVLVTARAIQPGRKDNYIIQYQDADGVMRDVSAYTNYEPTPGQRIAARTYIVDDQPYTAEYLPAYDFVNEEAYMLCLGISWCEDWPEDDLQGD